MVNFGHEMLIILWQLYINIVSKFSKYMYFHDFDLGITITKDFGQALGSETPCPNDCGAVL